VTVYDRSRSLLQMISPLGEDALIPVALSGSEAIGEPYCYRVALVSEQTAIDPRQVLHQPGCVILRRDIEVARYFSGVFQSFTVDGTPRQGMAAYSATLVPRLWFLNQTIDCRIFQRLSVVEILRQLFEDAGLTRFEFRIFGERRPLPYTSQYNETDFQFATRLMEASGYFYFFEHRRDGELLVIADANAAFPDIPGGRLRFESSASAEDVLTDWTRPDATRYGRVVLKDYDPTAPAAPLDGVGQGGAAADGASARDVFVWPAHSYDESEIGDRARWMLEAAEAEVLQSSATSRFRPLVAGGRFQLERDPLGGPGGGHIVRALSVEMADESWTTGGGAPIYRNRMSCFSDKVPWRHPIATPRPRMPGVYSAVVLGGAGEEIHTDELGRVKVRLKWDRRGDTSAERTIWARVIQPWAGGQFGSQFIPRVGTEVAVAFVDGDPDRPVVLGGLYNGNQTPIYGVAEKTKSGLRSRSSPGGSQADFNELTFDDRTGAEQVYLRAQKDLLSEVVHDATARVGRHQTVEIGVGRDTTLADGDDRLTVAKGDLAVAVSEGKVSVTALHSIELTVGSSVLRIDQGGISLSAQTIAITGRLSSSVSGAQVRVSGDAEVVIQGGLVRIN
jgi:type VI secretion system secreted protein VgrG